MGLNRGKCVVIALCAALTGCGLSAKTDPNSRQLVYVSHGASTPIASLAISDEGGYRFLDQESRSEVAGQLEVGELSQVQGHAAQGPTRDLVANQVNDDRCESDELAYRIISKFGSACIVASEIGDPSVRAHADFFIALFASKTPKP
jgi:hypothetical protein